MPKTEKRILWLTGIVIPQASELINGSKVPFGGWVSQMIDKLSKLEEFTIGIAMKSPTDKLLIKEKDGVTYYYVPQNKKNRFDVNEEDCLEVFNHFKPNLLHAEGSEQKYTNTFLSLWKGLNVLSLQGVLNGYEPYEYGGLNMYKYLFSLNFKNTLFAGLSMLNKKFVFNKRLVIEKDTIKKAKNILGRTTWDRANSYFYNPSAPYYHCARILRPSFYKIKQDGKEVIKHSVFIGNSAQARKGAHFVLEAIGLLKEEYPDIKLYITGHKYEKNIKDWKSYFGYRALLQRIIKKLDLEDNIIFLGVLQEREMAQQISKINVYVMSSIIENSPNTLGEAMIMGVPCITSFNGGVADMATDQLEALHYRDNDPRMLAFQIKRILDSKELAEKLSKNAMIKARATHNPEKNLNDLLNCYRSILS
jgi:glycosyltransferase involved in cell wall biosynthesis|tara:strand:+ start:3503 stop:4762 length:1260 start_codon:yes stop_codon:yes gene_type:complete